MTSFAVAAIVREEREILEVFVDYYLSLGAVEVALYCDGPAPEGFAPTDPRVRLIICDAEFWRGLGLVNPDFYQRQSTAYSHHVLHAPGDWTLIVDADELVFGDGPIGDLLDRVPAEIEGIRLPTAEAVYGPGDDEDGLFGSTWFRVAMTGRLQRALPLIYGSEVAQLLEKGLLGHSQGKQFVRNGTQGLEIRAHSAFRDGVRITRDARVWMTDTKRWWVGHFDAISFERWIAKWKLRGQRRAVSRNRNSRKRQMSQVLEAVEAGPSQARSVFRRHYRASGLQLMVLRAAGFAFQRNVL